MPGWAQTAAPRFDHRWALAGRKVELSAEDGLRVAPTDFQVEWQQDATSGRINGAASASFLDLAVIARLAAFLPLDPRSGQAKGRVIRQESRAPIITAGAKSSPSAASGTPKASAMSRATIIASAAGGMPGRPSRLAP